MTPAFWVPTGPTQRAKTPWTIGNALYVPRHIALTGRRGNPTLPLAPRHMPQQHGRANIKEAIGEIEDRPIEIDRFDLNVQPIANGINRLSFARIGPLPFESGKAETIVEISENSGHDCGQRDSQPSVAGGSANGKPNQDP